MGLYIEGLEMPEDREIMIRIDSSGMVMTEYGLPIDGTKAVYIPYHGRLIDADALVGDSFVSEIRGVKMLSSRFIYLDAIADAPTVIPASKDG